MCTQESNPPIVQIGLNHDSIKAQPVGQVVRFSVSAKMYEPLLRFMALPTGRAITVAKMRIKFMTTKTVCSFPMILDSVDARIP